MPRWPCSARWSAENEAKAAEPSIASQTEVVDKLKHGLDQMKGKLNELTSKRNELVARSKTVAAQSQVHDALKSIDIMDPTSEVGRFEEKIRREEAKVRGQQELAASSLDAQFNSLEDLGEQTEIEARLAALKSGGSPAAIGAGERAAAVRFHRRRGRLRQALGQPRRFPPDATFRICRGRARREPTTSGSPCRGPALVVPCLPRVPAGSPLCGCACTVDPCLRPLSGSATTSGWMTTRP